MQDHSHLAEITVSYKTKVKVQDRPKITSSTDADKMLFHLWGKDRIKYQESFYLLHISKAKAVLGYEFASIGGMAGTVVDI